MTEAARCGQDAEYRRRLAALLEFFEGRRLIPLEEVNEMLQDLGRDKAYLDTEDIMKRYDVGINAAQGIIRSIRAMCGGGKLGKGKVLPSEVAYWESEVDKRRVRI